MSAKILVDREQIADVCRRYRVQKLSLFGSVLRNDFQPTSDVDVLVEFEPKVSAGFLRLAAMEFELSQLLGRRADVRTPFELSRYFRDEVLRTAEVQYVRG
jgi:predicted nucleotidyltransferase